MIEPPQGNNLPAQIASAISSIPSALVPSSVKALDRLIGAAADIPAAWLAQQKAKIDAQTQAYVAVEGAIANAVASEAGAAPEIVQRAINVLVRKEYRKQRNREAVASAMIDDLSTSAQQSEASSTTDATLKIEDEWLNVFERYAEDASSDRMQKLWGRVLAGEVRRPGKFSLRTLRFLSEFSQADALSFAAFGESVFGDTAPKSLVKPDDLQDVRDLVYLESAGLIQGASGIGLEQTLRFNESGQAFMRENEFVLVIQGEPGNTIKNDVMALTPLGQELLSLIPQRDARAAARRVALNMRTPVLKSAYLATVVGQEIVPMEIIWQEEAHTSG